MLQHNDIDLKEDLKMSNNKKILVFLLILFISFILFSCGGEDKNDFRKLIASIPAKNLKNYSFCPKTPLPLRIKPVSEFVLNYLKAMDSMDEYTAYTPSEEDLALIEEYMRKLPELHKRILEERLIGIYFVNNFKGSGVTDCVFDEKNNIYAILTFNSEVLKSNISEWLTFKENTCFVKNNSDILIEINCGKELKGFMYILLHETTHIVDYVVNYTPYVDESITEIKEFEVKDTNFVKEIWERHYKPSQEYEFQWREKVSFYGFNDGPHINITDALMVYKQLSKTPFVSIYGSKNWAEDFAEFVTFYHLTTNLDQPYEIKYFKKGQLVYKYSPMESPKVMKRFPHVQGIYQH